MALTQGTKPRLRRFLGATIAASAFACSEQAGERGELMVSVTTDMAVPTDIDTLVWKVTLSGESQPYASGAVNLTTGLDFPVTLAIVPGPKTTAPVTVRVEGRRGGENELLRVSREARLLVPNDRVAKLSLQLSWLCSEANLSEPCAEGMTCRAGACVDANVETEALPDYEPAEPAACFDLTACFDQARLVVAGPEGDADTGGARCAIVGTRPLGHDANVNIAVEVANERVGNYGFCGPFGECFIPLHRNAEPEGWQILRSGETPAIRLPDLVCQQALSSIGRVAVLTTGPGCPVDRGDRPLCAPPPDACLTANICPPTSPEDSWSGFACSGAATPSQYDPGLLGCWSPPTEEGVASPADDGRKCCLKGQAPAGDPLVIDDMSGGPQIKLAPPAGHFAGWWFADVPEGSGDLFPAPEPSLYTYRIIDPPIVRDGEPEIRRAACLRSRGFLGWVALQGFFFRNKFGVYGAASLDVSRYSGISFWGWSEERFEGAYQTVNVLFPNTQTSTEPGSACFTPEGGDSACDNFFTEVTLTNRWQRFEVLWEDLHQSRDDWGQQRFDEFAPDVYAVAFGVRGAGPQITSQPFDFCIADIEFLE